MCACSGTESDARVYLLMCVCAQVREAMDTRDAMVKQLYSYMFEWIIRKINVTLEKNAGTASSRNAKDSIIGLLDIFGFESFITNRCTNACIGRRSSLFSWKECDGEWRSPLAWLAAA
jgi:Myosin head (motor domain)